MAKIHVLEKQVAELIAAGEVIERPASIVKELVENSIDAGASHITVEIQNGGISYIRVLDNGCGIAKEDVANAFLRHATSKVLSSADLDKIITLGFRGEALASIAAVSHVEMLTKTADEAYGTKICLSGGEVLSIEEAGSSGGTNIVIKDLFYNTPARMKFLKKDVSEANAIAGILEKLALSNPQIAFRFSRDGKQTLKTPGDGDLYACIYAVFGKNFADTLMPVEYNYNGIKVQGYACKPAGARANRSMQHFFINGRFIKSKTCMAALEEAYRHSIMVSKYPTCVLNIALPPEVTDVNVHPAKLEVRFADEKPVFQSIYYAVKNALQNFDTPSTMHLHTPQKDKIERVFTANEKVEQTLLKHSKSITNSSKPVITIQPVIHNTPTESVKEESVFIPQNKPDMFRDGTVSASFTIPKTSFIVQREPDVEIMPDEPEKGTASTEEKSCIAEEAVQEQTAAEYLSPAFRVIGEIFQTYILVQQGQKIFIIDKHAAHERILYEKLKEQKHEQRQILLVPILLHLSKEEYNVLLQNLDVLKQSGFVIDEFGEQSLAVHEIPTFLQPGDIEDILCEMAGNFLAHKKYTQYEKIDWLYHSMACRGAIKAHDKSTLKELEILAQQVLENKQIRYCPHGRPVLIELTQKEIEKQFGRIG